MLQQIPENYLLDLINVITLTLLVVMKVKYREAFQSFIKLYWEDHFIHQEIKEQKKTHLFKFTFSLLTAVYFGLMTSSFVLHFEVIHKGEFWFNFYFFSLAFLAFILLKNLIIKLLGYVFELKGHSNYLSVFKFNKSIYLFFLFFTGQILIHYSTIDTIHIALLIVSLGIIYLAISALSFQLRFQNEIIRHWYYFILYLCTLEIAPYIILYKAISDSVN